MYMNMILSARNNHITADKVYLTVVEGIRARGWRMEFELCQRFIETIGIIFKRPPAHTQNGRP